MPPTVRRYRAGDEPVAGYRLISFLGKGGFGEVWKANGPGGTKCALKLIDLTGKQGVREFDSLRLVKGIQHPNLIQLQAFWLTDDEGTVFPDDWDSKPLEEGGRKSSPITETCEFEHGKPQLPTQLIIAMQLGSRSLFDVLEKHQKLGHSGVPVEELLNYMDGAAKGIDFLHNPQEDPESSGTNPAQAIIHGDIKPQNILVVGGEAAVCDFGLAKAVDSLRKTSMTPVTLAYAAPEALNGKPGIESDLYSFAIAYYELRTGTLPFDDKLSGPQVMMAHINGNLDLRKLPQPEREVIQRGLLNDYRQRWNSATEMARALRRAVESNPDTAKQSGTMTLPTLPDEGSSKFNTMLPPGSWNSPMAGRPTESIVRGITPSHTPSEPLSITGSYDSQYSTITAPTQPAPKIKTNGRLKAVALLCAMLVALAGVGLIIANKRPKVGADLAKQVAQQIIDGKYPAAAKQLEVNADAEFGGPVRKADLRDKLQEAWLSACVKLVDKSEANKAQAMCRELLQTFPKEVEARVALVRADRLLGDQTAAAQDLAPLAAITEPAWSRYLHRQLSLLLATDNEQSKEKNAWALAAELQAINADSVPVNLPESVKQTEDELLELKLFSNELKPILLNSLKDRPAGDELTADAQLLVALYSDDNRMRVELLDSLRKAKKLSEARQVAAAIAKDPGDPELVLACALLDLDELQLDLVRFQAVLKMLRSVADKPSELSKLSPKRASDVCLQIIAKTNVHSALRTEAFTLIQKISKGAREIDPKVVESVKAWEDSEKAIVDAGDLAKELLTARVPDWKKWKDACEQALKTNDKSLLLKACLAECQIEQGQANSAAALIATADANDPINRYVHYVKALGLARAGTQTKWADVSVEMMAAFPNSGPAANNDPLGMPYRRESAGNLLLIAAKQLRKKIDPVTLGEWISPPYKSGKADAEQAYKWLTLARSLRDSVATKTAAIQRAGGPAVNKPPVAGNSKVIVANAVGPAVADVSPLEITRDLATNLALAAYHKPTTDWLKAEEMLNLLATLPSGGPDADPFPLQYVRYQVKSNAGARQETITSALQLLLLFRKQFPENGEQAVVMYDKVLRGALSLAEIEFNSTKNATANRAANLHELYGSAGQFIQDYLRARWTFTSASGATVEKKKMLQTLFARAIELKPLEPAYHVGLGRSALDGSSSHDDLVAATANADEALKVSKGKYAPAYALKGNLLILSSRQNPSRSGLLIDLEKAGEACQKADDLAKRDNPNDPKRAEFLRLMGMAKMERANYEIDPTLSLQAKLLTEAVGHIEAAAAIPDHEYQEFTYAALGNTYEDLAWLAKQDPEANFDKAIKAFNEAIRIDGFSAQMKCNHGRCFVKYLVEMRLDPAAIDFTREAMLDKAAEYLEAAQLSEESAIEAMFYLGRVCQARGDLTAADDYYLKVLDKARQQKSTSEAIYASTWILLPLDPQFQPEFTPAHRTARVIERTQRLKEIKLLPPGWTSTEIENEISFATATALSREQRWSEAKTFLDQAVTRGLRADLKGIDRLVAESAKAKLYSARSEVNLQLALAARGAAQTNLSVGAIKDANDAAKFSLANADLIESRKAAGKAMGYRLQLNFDSYADKASCLDEFLANGESLWILVRDKKAKENRLPDDLASRFVDRAQLLSKFFGTNPTAAQLNDLKVLGKRGLDLIDSAIQKAEEQRNESQRIRLQGVREQLLKGLQQARAA